MSGEVDIQKMLIDENDEEKRQLKTVNRSLQLQLKRAKEKSEDLVDAVWAGSRDAVVSLGAYRPVPPPPKDPRRKKIEVALWDMGDWRGAKLTRTYNSTVMAERVMKYCKKAQRITEIQRADHAVKDCTIIFGGDMVEGLFNFPTQPYEVDMTLFDQYANVSRLLIDVVRYALSIYEHVTIVAEWGNHGRIGSKRDGVPRHDNVDRMCYEFARQMLKDELRLSWPDCPEDIQRLEIGNYRAIVIHGDEIGRNGFASPSTIANWVVRQKSGAYPWSFQDCYCHHYHQHGETALPDGTGAIYQTASTESDNRYAGVTMAASAIPTQRLHFIDPDEGIVTNQYKIRLEASIPDPERVSA